MQTIPLLRNSFMIQGSKQFFASGIPVFLTVVKGKVSRKAPLSVEILGKAKCPSLSRRSGNH